MKELVSGRDSALSKRTSFKMIIFLQRINYGKALKVGAEEIGTEPLFYLKCYSPPDVGIWIKSDRRPDLKYLLNQGGNRNYRMDFAALRKKMRNESST